MSATSAARAEGKRKAAILRTIDPDGPMCECGVALDVHPPLRSPGPLMARVPSPNSRRPPNNAFGSGLMRVTRP